MMYLPIRNMKEQETFLKVYYKNNCLYKDENRWKFSGFIMDLNWQDI